MIEVTIPLIGESVSTVFVSRWLKAVGEAVAEGEPLLELDSDKASMEVPSPSDGVLVEQLAGEGDEIAVGAVVARLDASAAASVAPAAAGEAASTAMGGPKAGPAARHTATERGVDLSLIEGTGPRGRIVSEDVRQHTAPSAAPAPTAAAPPVPASSDSIDRVPMSPLRRTIARRLVAAQQEAAMLTTFNEVDLSAIIALRRAHQERFIERHGIKLGFMSFFVKASIEALKAFPAVNAEIEGHDILYKRFYHIGVAVSGPKGLVVPVVRDADRLSFAQTEQAISGLAKRAKQNTLRLADFRDGTFTISNGGVFGSMLSTPILNPPQVGILGMHNIIQRPVGVDGEVVLRPMMYLALTYDHRVIDGREAVGFLSRIKECVESPERILLEV
jgi:2-oxoglutarate dehydrogenase E2 component (dihydrolipoamide succinyltransferase)